MNLSSRPKVILQDSKSGDYLGNFHNNPNDRTTPLWVSSQSKALVMNMPQVFALSDAWPFLETCTLLPALRGE